MHPPVLSFLLFCQITFPRQKGPCSSQLTCSSDVTGRYQGQGRSNPLPAPLTTHSPRPAPHQFSLMPALAGAFPGDKFHRHHFHQSKKRGTSSPNTKGKHRVNESTRKRTLEFQLCTVRFTARTPWSGTDDGQLPSVDTTMTKCHFSE